MTTIRINLPDSLARNAKEAGLLEPQALEALLRDELVRRRTLEELLRSADRLPSQEASSEEETRAVVQEEIDAYRAEKRSQRADRP